MNYIELMTVKEVGKLINVVLEGEVENIEAAYRIKELVEELVEFKDFRVEFKDFRRD